MNGSCCLRLKNINHTPWLPYQSSLGAPLPVLLPRLGRLRCHRSGGSWPLGGPG